MKLKELKEVLETVQKEGEVSVQKAEDAITAYRESQTISVKAIFETYHQMRKDWQNMAGHPIEYHALIELVDSIVAEQETK